MVQKSASRRAPAMLALLALLAVRAEAAPALDAGDLVRSPSGPPAAPPTGPAKAPPSPASSADPGEEAERRLLEAHLAMELDGDGPRARSLLVGVQDSAAPARLRARAALGLAEQDELDGDTRTAVSHLDLARSLVGPGHALALEADERRGRILEADPLADVRGPLPGAAPLRGEPASVQARFQRAAALLRAFHGVQVAPKIEDISETLQVKRRALGRALKAYELAAAAGGVEARAAALFRKGALFHHMAESLAFEIPPELLPAAADRLRRQLRAESSADLKRSLQSYRAAAALPPVPAAAAWRSLAAREAALLEALF